MLRKIAAIIAAAACAGLLVTFVPGIAPEVAAGATDIESGRDDQKIVCTQSWPHYEQSCLRGSQSVGTARAVRIIAADRSPADRFGQIRP